MPVPEIFRRIFPGIFYNGFSLKNFEQILLKKILRKPEIKFSHDPLLKKNLNALPLKPLPKTPSKSTLQPLQSGHETPSVPPKFPKNAQNEPRLGEDHPQFDRKLLDKLHEGRVRKES
jgi:hypothetical protein